MEILYYAAGVIIMAFAIAVSIALHEVGHLVPAKLFGVHVPQYMIGFGKTIFSFRRGETEYGFKAIPLGGYISMIGMYPPAVQEKTDASAEEDASTEREKVTASAAAGTVAGQAVSETAELTGDTAEPAENTLYPSGRCVPGTPACWHRSLLLPVRRMPNVSSLAMRTVSSISCRCISALSLCSAGRS
ncbi:membrane-associated zinc metalloprotease [Rothia aeria]|uniref:Membrane-associated zinc metalloprotease n=1 Tax=Rothia aeria TaxID=172042 RepID=A0A2Z5QYI0_9MICC|nr:membrane-associated zinc metalloprotease [Rothia aeria]